MEGRAGTPQLEVEWRWGRAWQSSVWVGAVGEEGRRPGRPRGRRSKGCLRLVARGWQNRGEANIRHSGRTLWAEVGGEVSERLVGCRLPQSGRSTQRRWRGPLGTQSGDGSEGEARGRLSGDCDSAFNIEGGGWKERMEAEEKWIDEKKEMENQDELWGILQINAGALRRRDVLDTQQLKMPRISRKLWVFLLPAERHWGCAVETGWRECPHTPHHFWPGVFATLPHRWRERCPDDWCLRFCPRTSFHPPCEWAWSSRPAIRGWNFGISRSL